MKVEFDNNGNPKTDTATKGFAKIRQHNLITNCTNLSKLWILGKTTDLPNLSSEKKRLLQEQIENKINLGMSTIPKDHQVQVWNDWTFIVNHKIEVVSKEGNKELHTFESRKLNGKNIYYDLTEMCKQISLCKDKTKKQQMQTQLDGLRKLEKPNHY